MQKRGDITWESIAKLLIALAVLLFLIFFVWLLKDEIYILFDKFKGLIRFGGG